MSAIVRLRYPTAGAFRFDCLTQIGAGGLLVDHDHEGDLPEMPEEISLEIIIDGTVLLRVPAEIVELAETTLQLGLGERACAMIERAGEVRFADISADGTRQGIASLHPTSAATSAASGATASGDSGPASSGGTSESDSLERRLKLMTAAERIQVALHGGREERVHLLRERMPNVQAALVRNPKLTSDELLALARSPHLGAEAAEAISKHPAWGTSAQVAMALVRNPKTPTPIALKLIPSLQTTDLRIVAKGGAVREQIAAAARKRLLGT